MLVGKIAGKKQLLKTVSLTVCLTNRTADWPTVSNQQTSQSTNYPTNQPNNQPTNQPTNQITNQPELHYKATNQVTNHLTNQLPKTNQLNKLFYAAESFLNVY